MEIMMIIWIIFDIMFKCWITDFITKNNQIKRDLEKAQSEMEDYADEIEHLKEQLDDLERDIEDNYKPIPVSEQVGVSDRDFI